MVGPASTDHDSLRLRPGAEAIVIKDLRGWNGGPGSTPSILSLGRITHHPSPSLNTASAQNSQSRGGCQEARTGDPARPAHSGGAPWAKAHTSLGHKGAPSFGHPALSGSPPPARLPPGCTLLTQESRQLLHPFHKAGLPAGAKWKTLQKHHPHHIGKCSRPPPAPPPPRSASLQESPGLPQVQAKTIGAILGCMGVFLQLWLGLIPGEREAVTSSRPS